MSWSLIVYLIELATCLKALCIIAGIAMLIVAFITVIDIEAPLNDPMERNHDGLHWLYKRWPIIAIGLIVIGTLVPSSDTCKKMVAAHIAEDVVKSDRTQDNVDKVLKTMELGLDKAINKLEEK